MYSVMEAYSSNAQSVKSNVKPKNPHAQQTTFGLVCMIKLTTSSLSINSLPNLRKRILNAIIVVEIIVVGTAWSSSQCLKIIEPILHDNGLVICTSNFVLFKVEPTERTTFAIRCANAFVDSRSNDRWEPDERQVPDPCSNKQTFTGEK